MPVNIRTRQMAVKDPSTGEYDAFDAIAINNTKNRIAEIDAAAKRILDSLPAEYTDTVERVDGLERALIRNEAFGEIASFNDGADDLPIDSLKIRLEPQQDLHGYDHPWPGGGGKNKLDTRPETIKPLNTGGLWNGNTYTKNGCTFTVAEDGTITVDGTATTTAFLELGSFLTGDNAYKINGLQSVATFQFVAIVDGTWYGSRDGDGREIPAEKTCRICVYVSTGTTINKVTISPMIRLASETDATFAPYSNVCPITGHTETKVTRTGKNLLKTSGLSYVPPSSTAFGTDTKRIFVENSYCNGITYNNACQVGRASDIAVSENSIQFTTNARAYGVNIPVIGLKAGRACTVSAIITNGLIGVGFYEQDGTYISGTPNANSFTVPDRTYYVLLAFQAVTENEQSVFTEIQLELGSTETDYEPYAGESYSVEFPSEAGTVYGGELTVNADGSGSLVVDKAKVTFDGTENWIKARNLNCYYVLHNDLAKIPDYTNSIICNRLSTVKYAARYLIDYSITGYYYNTYPGLNWFYIKITDDVSTVSDAKKWIAENNLDVIYPLAEPITYTLTASQIRTILGQNHIFASNGSNVDVKYKADTKIYIDNKFSELSALIANL